MDQNNPQKNSDDGKTTRRQWGWQHPKTFTWLIAVLAGLIVLVGVFALGIQVGLNRARFTNSWIVNYRGNFGGSGMIPPPAQGQYLKAFGVSGTILSVNGSQLVIKDTDNTEKTVIVSPSTTIRENFQSLTSGNLKVNEQIVVLGDPNNQGQINATFIRVLN